MYPNGVRQLVEGWSKNIAGGTGKTRVIAVLIAVLWVGLCVQAPWLGWPFYLVVVAQLLWITRRIGRFGVLAIALYPIPLVAFLLIYVRSIYLTYVRKRVSWKGRDLNPLA
jgi:4,4'-diaponeurosporenoate glycosyltransferase